MGHILLDAHLPGALSPTFIAAEDIEEGGCGRVHGGDLHVIHFEHKLCSSQDPGGVHAPAVAALGVDGEGGVLADGVRVVVVMPFPGVIVVVEDEVAGEEENLGPHLTALAHPLAVQAHSQVGLGGQEWRAVLIRPVDDAAGDAGVIVVLGVLQRWLVAGRTVEHPLQGICMDVAEEELLHQAVQVVQWVLLLHPDELQLMHGEVDSFGALTAVLFPPQVVGHILHPGTPREDEAGARAVHQLAELLGYCLRVAYDLHIVQLVVGLGAPTDDPGGLAQADLAPDDEGVRGAGAAVAAVVELVGLEGVVVVESVGPCEELWAWPHLTASGHPVALDGWWHLHSDPGTIVEMFEHVMAL